MDGPRIDLIVSDDSGEISFEIKGAAVVPVIGGTMDTPRGIHLVTALHYDFHHLGDVRVHVKIV